MISSFYICVFFNILGVKISWDIFFCPSYIIFFLFSYQLIGASFVKCLDTFSLKPLSHWAWNHAACKNHTAWFHTQSFTRGILLRLTLSVLHCCSPRVIKCLVWKIEHEIKLCDFYTQRDFTPCVKGAIGLPIIQLHETPAERTSALRTSPHNGL